MRMKKDPDPEADDESDEPDYFDDLPVHERFTKMKRIKGLR